MDKVRNAVVDLLVQVEQDQSYSTISLKKVIEQQKWTAKDKGLLTELFYGTIQRKMTIDFYLAPYIQKAKKIQPWVKQLLRISIYQMVFLDKIPDHAAIFEAVQIAKKRGHQGIAKFVNGVLRNFQRNDLRSFEEIKDADERMSVQYSIPKWMYQLFKQQYGVEQAQQISESILTAPSVSVRIQPNYLSQEQVKQLLEEEGVQTRESMLSNRCLIVEEGNIFQSKAFEQGLITIQDEASSLVAQVANLQPANKVLDTCAAPGGKTTHIASYLDPSKGGQVDALDLYEHKLKKIQENAKRLQVEDCISMKVLDARTVHEVYPTESFDAVFVDAPCSGLGLVRRKPDIKYTKELKDLKSLEKIQLEILISASKMVKSKGSLVYSTCTINKSENRELVNQFLKMNPEFGIEPIGQRIHKDTEDITILPSDFNSDGFYICKLIKKS